MALELFILNCSCLSVNSLGRDHQVLALSDPSVAWCQEPLSHLNMPGKASLRCYSASNMGDTKPGTVGPEGIMDGEHFKIVMLESLGDDAIVRKLQDIFTPSFNRLTEAVDQFVKTNQLLRQHLQEKDATIVLLQQRWKALENKADDMEQWTRRSSMRIQGLPETGQGQVEDKILSLCNQDLRMDPTLQLEEIEVAHHLPRPAGEQTARSASRGDLQHPSLQPLQLHHCLEAMPTTQFLLPLETMVLPPPASRMLHCPRVWWLWSSWAEGLKQG